MPAKFGHDEYNYGGPIMSVPTADRAASPSGVSRLTSITRVNDQLTIDTRPVHIVTWSRTRPVITLEPQKTEGQPRDIGRDRVAFATRWADCGG